jgi:DNA-binding transcriptional MerR regulator
MRTRARLYDLKQVARHTGVSYSTIRRWNKRGLLPKPFVKSGAKRKYWTPGQIARWRMTKVFSIAHEDECQ